MATKAGAGRTEADRRARTSFWGKLVNRPEIGAFFVMIIVLAALGMASGGLTGGASWNPFDGTAYNPLGLRNNTRIVAQLGIIAIGACLLMIAGEFDLSIGSMIGFAGMSMALMLKWGFAIRIPFTEITLVSFDYISPLMAVLLTLCMTLAFGFLIGNIVVRSKLPSFIVTLAFLFFIRGLTEVCYRFLNRAPGERSGSTQVSDLPDFKNLIDLEPYRDMLGYAKAQASQLAQGCLSVFQRPLNNNLASAEQVQAFIGNTSAGSKLTDAQLAAIVERAGPGNDLTKDQIAEVVNQVCAVDPASVPMVMDRATAKALPDADLASIFSTLSPERVDGLRQALESRALLDATRRAAAAGRDAPGQLPAIPDLQVAREHIESISTINPVANMFGGDIFEPVFDWLYRIGFNINPGGSQWVEGLYAVVGWWLAIALVAWFVLERTKAGNWIYATGGNLQAARANGVPTDAVKISLFMVTAFCATIFAATQVFDTNSADAAKGNLKELEAIATAVVGGAILTGGFGSIVGVVFGAIIFGLAQNALFYIPWLDGAYYRMFLGSILLAAALLNENVRKRFTGGI
ncbi:MAG: ABC transporter permease [Alphaproteobacteria bacterium]